MKEPLSHSTIADRESQSPTIRHTSVDDTTLTALGYEPVLRRNRSTLYLLFQTLAIAAIPFGFGGPLISAIYGGGQLSMFVGWVVVCLLDECVALSLSELASRYPTSAGCYYWAFQLTKTPGTGKDGNRTAKLLSFFTGWAWLVGNWTITLSVNFGFASLVVASVSMYHPDWVATAWQQLLIFYAICVVSFFICAFGNRLLPYVDTAAAAFTAISIVVVLIVLSITAKAGRHSASYALGHYEETFSGWGGFTFFIGLLPSAYTFSAIGMIASMAEESANPTVQVPLAISLCIPVGGIAGLFYVLPLCFTMPPLAEVILAPYGQALPYVFQYVTGSPGGGLALVFLVLVITLFCSISITTAASRCTWAFARDDAIPFSSFWTKTTHSVPVPALFLVTIVQMLLGLINLGSSSAFLAFVSVGVIALAVSYAVPIAISLFNRRSEVNSARWNCGNTIGYIANVVAVVWIMFELVLFSMPAALPVTAVSMNYAIVVFVGFMAIAAGWYLIHARKGMGLNSFINNPWFTSLFLDDRLLEHSC